jgi:hypothetical protein
MEEKEIIEYVLTFLKKGKGLPYAYKEACKNNPKCKDMSFNKAFVNKAKHNPTYRRFKKKELKKINKNKIDACNKKANEFLESWFDGRVITTEIEAVFKKVGRENELNEL